MDSSGDDADGDAVHDEAMTRLRPLADLFIGARRQAESLLDNCCPREEWLERVQRRAARDWRGEWETATVTVLKAVKNNDGLGTVRRACEDAGEVFGMMVRFVPAVTWCRDPDAWYPEDAPAAAFRPESTLTVEAIRAAFRGVLQRLGSALEAALSIPNQFVLTDYHIEVLEALEKSGGWTSWKSLQRRKMSDRDASVIRSRGSDLKQNGFVESKGHSHRLTEYGRNWLLSRRDLSKHYA